MELSPPRGAPPSSDSPLSGEKRGQSSKSLQTITKETNSSEKSLNSKAEHPLIREARVEGLKQAYAQIIAEQRTNRRKLTTILNQSEKVLARVRNLVPFFTDEVVITANKITIINRPFFFSEHIQSIPIKNITDVFIETIPFIGTIRIKDTASQNEEIKIKWFWKREAEKIRSIVAGLVEMSKEEVDLKHIEDHDLTEKATQIGRIRDVNLSVN